MSANGIRGILFDKDGTLLDFDATWPPAYQAVADDMARLAGDPGLADRLMRLGGYGADGVLDPASVFACGSTAEIVAFCAAQPELAGNGDIAARVDRQFTGFGARGPLIIDDLAAVLESLNARAALGIATNDSAASAEAWVAHHGFGRFFRFISGADSGYGAKPDPAVFEAFCAQTGLSAGEVCMVGDTIKDAELARNAAAGLSVIVESGVPAGEALAARADVVIGSVAELEGVLG